MVVSLPSKPSLTQNLCNSATDLPAATHMVTATLSASSFVFNHIPVLHNGITLQLLHRLLSGLRQCINPLR